MTNADAMIALSVEGLGASDEVQYRQCLPIARRDRYANPNKRAPLLRTIGPYLSRRFIPANLFKQVQGRWIDLGELATMNLLVSAKSNLPTPQSLPTLRSYRGRKQAFASAIDQGRPHAFQLPVACERENGSSQEGRRACSLSSVPT